MITVYRKRGRRRTRERQNRDPACAAPAGGVGLLIRRLERRCDPKLRRPHIGIVVESAEDTGSVWMTVRYNGERLDVTQDGDRLSLAVLTSTESEMEYSFDAAHTLPNQLRLRIKGNGA